MPADVERLRPLLARLLAETAASAVFWRGGGGMPSGTAVDLLRPSGPLDGTIDGGRVCGEITTRLSSRALALLDAIEQQRIAVGMTCLQAVEDRSTGAAAAAWNPTTGGVLLLPPGQGHPFSLDARALLADLPEGQTHLVSGLSAHERIARAAHGPLWRDGTAVEPLLSSVALPAGVRQGLALRQGRAVALVEGQRGLPLFHRIP
jgi:hypothetical protein